MMEHSCIKAPKAGKKKSPNIFSNEVADRVTLEYFQSKSSSLISSTCPECVLTSSINKNPGCDKIIKELAPRHYPFSNCRISKRITSFDEQYLSHCLELIQVSAAKAASYNISVAWRSPSRNSCSTESFLSERNGSIAGSLSAGSGKVVVSPSKKWNLGSETRSGSMIDIQRSPLFRNGRANKNDTNSEADSLASIKESLDSYRYGYPGGLSLCSSPMVDRETRKELYGSNGVPANDSSFMSTSSDMSSCTSVAVSHGMLQCTWSNGIPHFVFYLDNKRDAYVTQPSKHAASDGSGLDWTYFFHRWTRCSNQKEYDSGRSKSDLVGRMNVSAPLYRICADSSRVSETEFILYGDNVHGEGELQGAIYDTRRSHARIPARVSKFFKPLHLPKHLPWGASTLTDFCTWKPEQAQDEDCDSDHIGHPNLLESSVASNFELAAIFFTEHVQVRQQETEVGGWGLSFLKRAKERQETNNCQSACEASVDVIVPAGYHGGPKTRDGGPSTLMERWRSGGQCDCGGWDTGCPLTVLNARSNTQEYDPASQRKGLDHSLHLFAKGDEGHAPSMKMVNIQKGLYYIDFQSKLSALQCFSIAVAIIHNRSPTLRPKSHPS
uniref:Uncharacterized protein n=1 Tax=Kalanchoe fedtschenkoi TaxID=63787 RepID=A0A7N0V5Q7_KALFE